MTAIATPMAASRRQRSTDTPGAPRSRSAGSSPVQMTASSVRSRGRGGTLLFEVPFTSAMSDSDLAVLAHVLDLSTHMYPKMRPDPTSPGVARLDHFSGLFLERGAEQGQWVLEARTWGNPAPESVHEWHVLAAQAARQLDRRVALPERFPDPAARDNGRPVGRVAIRRLHARRLVGLR